MALTKDHKTILIVLGSVTLTSALGIYTYKKIKQSIANKEQLKSLDSGTPSTAAKQIKMAFENDGFFGTNVPALRTALVAIPSREFWDDVIVSYKKLYSRNLIEDMSDELQSSEYNEMIFIISSKPNKTGEPSKDKYVAWAKRLKAAFDKEYGFFPATDEDAIKAVFSEIPTQSDYREVENSYQILYGTSLQDALESELEFWEIDEFLEIIENKP